MLVGFQDTGMLTEAWNGRTWSSDTIDSPDSAAHARRGFCGECGSSLFWASPEFQTISVAAGTLDGDTGVIAAGHIWVSQVGDYYELPDDGLPRWPRGTRG